MKRIVAWVCYPPVPRLARFAIVGTSGVIVNSGVLWLLKEHTQLPLAVASAAAIETAIWNNFLLNDAWTFHGTWIRRSWRARVMAFHITASAAAAVNISILLTIASKTDVDYLAANILAIGVAGALSYSGSTLWTWRPGVPAARSAAYLPDSKDRRIIVVVPTYNEAHNIRQLIDEVLAQEPRYEVLVVDDASPDGTGEAVAAKAATNERVHLLRRGTKLGMGTAYLHGFQEALRLGADLICQMDADFSHNPRDLPRLAAAARTADVVIGSRYVPGGRIDGWPLHRHLLSVGTSLAYRACLAIRLHDMTGGFKCWRREALEGLIISDVKCRGFAFQMEMNYLGWQAGYALAEVPVTFVERRRGHSKMSLAISVEAIGLLWRLAFGTPQIVAPDSLLQSRASNLSLEELQRP